MILKAVMHSKKTKAFTLIELIIVLVIVCIVGAMFMIFLRGQNNSWAGLREEYINPDAVRARAAVEHARQLEIQNTLKREELDLRKKELNQQTQK